MRTREWDELIAPQLMSALPGAWVARDGYLSRVADDGHLAWHVTRQVTRGGGYKFHAIIQPLYVVSEVMVGDLRADLGHGVPGVRSYFTETAVDQVPVDEVLGLITRYAVPYFNRYGTDLKSFLKLTTSFAKPRPQRRGTWTTEAWTAGAYSLRGDWRRAQRAWAGCLLELALFDDDLAPGLRKLAAQALDAHDTQTRSAVVGWLLENEAAMKRIWRLD